VAVRKFSDDGILQQKGDLPLAFIHINKTAGTSFGHSLFGLFHEKNISPPYRGDFAAMGTGDPKLRLYHGHMLASQWLAHGVPSLMVCMLRNPVDRIISQYKSFKALDNERDAQLWVDNANGAEALEVARASTFDDFLLSENHQIIGHIDNLQVQFLSKSGGSSGYPSTRSAIEMLERHFLFFGLAEDYHNSIRLLSWQLGRLRVGRGKQLNVSSDEGIEAKSEAAKDALRAYTYWDNIVYDAAREIFYDRIDKFEYYDPEPSYDTLREPEDLWPVAGTSGAATLRSWGASRPYSKKVQRIIIGDLTA
jgi:hypothetical protein